MWRMLGLFTRSSSGRIGRARGLVDCPSSLCAHRHLFDPPSSSHPISAPDISSFRLFLCSWRRQLKPAYFSGLLGLLPARRTLLSCLGRNSIVFRGAIRSAAGHGAILEGRLRWMAFSLERRQGFRLNDYYRRWNPWRSLRPTTDGVVYGLIGANIAGFFLWMIADHRFMIEHFTISLGNFKAGHLHTLITSAFSHMDGSHLLINMFGLYFFGSNIARLFGPDFLLKLYIAGAISGSIFYLLHKAFVASSAGIHMVYHSRDYALGASAAINAIMLLDVFLFPKNIIYINFFIPVPAALLGAGIIALDLYRVKKGDERVSGSAHLGGALVAALAWAMIKKRWI